MKYFFPLMLIFLLGNCCKQPSLRHSGSNRNTYESIDDTLHLPFDTLRVLELYNIPLSGDVLTELGNEQIDGLSKKWDTLELSLRNFACDCPNWHDESRVSKKPSGEMAPPYAYYIESASPDIVLSDQWCHINCTIRFIGKVYEKPGLPKNTEFTDPGPPLGNVFRYYKYEVILPAAIWGPSYHTGKREIPSDPQELILTSVLTIPKNWKKY